MYKAVARRHDGTLLHESEHDSLNDASEALAGEFRLNIREQQFLTSSWNLQYETEHFILSIERPE